MDDPLLRPIQSDHDYDRVAAIVDKLAVRVEGSLTPNEQSLLDTLTTLIEDYDREHVA